MRRIAVIAALAATLAVTAACSGGSDDPAPTPSVSSASSSSGTPSAGDSPSSSPPAPAATGILLEQPHAEVRGPAGWRRAEVIVPVIKSADDRHSASTVSLGEIQAFGGTSDLDELAHNALLALPYRPLPKKLPHTELDGVPVFHLAGMVQKHLYHEEFGANVDDRLVSLIFDLSDELSPAERREVVDSVVASFRWR